MNVTSIFSKKFLVQKLRGNVPIKFLTAAGRSADPRHGHEVSNMFQGDFELLFCTCKQQTTFLRGNARAKEIVHGIIEYPAWLQELGQSRVIEEAFRHIVPSSQLPGCLRIRNIPIPRGTYNRCERMARFKMERDTNHPRRKYTDRIIADSQRHNKISISSKGLSFFPFRFATSEMLQIVQNLCHTFVSLHVELVEIAFPKFEHNHPCLASGRRRHCDI